MPTDFMRRDVEMQLTSQFRAWSSSRVFLFSPALVSTQRWWLRQLYCSASSPQWTPLLITSVTSIAFPIVFSQPAHSRLCQGVMSCHGGGIITDAERHNYFPILRRLLISPSRWLKSSQNGLSVRLCGAKSKSSFRKRRPGRKALSVLCEFLYTISLPLRGADSLI